MEPETEDVPTPLMRPMDDSESATLPHPEVDVFSTPRNTQRDEVEYESK